MIKIYMSHVTFQNEFILLHRSSSQLWFVTMSVDKPPSISKLLYFNRQCLIKTQKNFSESFKKLLWLEDLLKSCFLNVQFKMQIVVQLFFHLGESRMLNVLSWSASMEHLAIKMQQNALSFCCLWLYGYGCFDFRCLCINVQECW